MKSVAVGRKVVWLQLLLSSVSIPDPSSKFLPRSAILASGSECDVIIVPSRLGDS